jgi:hypothetical protein
MTIDQVARTIQWSLEDHGPITKENLPVFLRRLRRDCEPRPDVYVAGSLNVHDANIPAAVVDEHGGFHILTSRNDETGRVLSLAWSEACNDWVPDSIDGGDFVAYTLQLPAGCKGLPSPYTGLISPVASTP